MLVVVAAAAGTAAVIDMRTRRIPNAISAGTAAVGLALAATGWSGVSVGSSVLGCLTGLLLMAPGRLLGATGGGDVKFMAAMGAVIGLERMPVAFIATLIAGGALAIAIAIRRGRLGATIGGTGRYFRSPLATRDQLESAGARNKFSYGPAIAAGAVLAAWLVR
jgi:prepilin peptidase CpaA